MRFNIYTPITNVSLESSAQALIHRINKRLYYPKELLSLANGKFYASDGNTESNQINPCVSPRSTMFAGLKTQLTENA